MEYAFNLDADYFQFSLEEESDLSDGSCGAPIAEGWTAQTVADMLVVVPHAIAVGTARYAIVPVTIELRDDAPPADNFDGWDHVTECSIEIGIGRLVVNGGDYWPDNARIPVPPGTYAVRILYGGLDTLSEDGLEGDDHYRVLLWPGAERPPAVLKRHMGGRRG